MTNLSRTERNIMMGMHALEMLCIASIVFSSDNSDKVLAALAVPEYWVAAPLIALPAISLLQSITLSIMSIKHVRRGDGIAMMCTCNAWYVRAVFDLLQGARDAVAVCCLLVVAVELALNRPEVLPALYLLLILPVVSSFRLVAIATYKVVESWNK